MTMGILWTGMVAAALVCGAVNGRLTAVTAAALEGAGAAVELTLAMAGALCLWSGVLEVMARSGMADGLSRLLRPVLRRLLPRAGDDSETLAALSANVSANLLGLGNAATPAGIRAAQRLAQGCGGVAVVGGVGNGGPAVRRTSAAAGEGVTWSLFPPGYCPCC